MKKRAFENAVLEFSQNLGRPYPPKVSITETPCPLSSADEIAHIHPFENLICIWIKKLETLTLDEIRETAAHEVAHLISIEHDAKHAEAKSVLELATWRPPGGVAVINGGKKASRTTKIVKEKRVNRKNICSYFSCKVKTNLATCEHCGKLFCKEHLEPKPPYLPDFKRAALETKIDMEIWRKPGGHPCPPYYDYLKVKEKEEIEKRWQALNKMRELKPVRERFPISIPENTEFLEKPELKSQKAKKILLALIIITLLAAILLFIMIQCGILTIPIPQL